MRWLWIDQFIGFKSGESAQAVKNLSLAEDLYRDHFPNYPVMPASLMLEGLAQTGGILVGEANDFRENVILAKITQATFSREVLAGEQLLYSVDLVYIRKEGASVRGTITVDGEQIAEAELMFAHLPAETAKELTGSERFVFAGELKKLLGLAELLADDNSN